MHSIDWAIILFYFVVVIGLGFWYRRRAARDLDAYFLGGKSIHWVGLAMSGAVSNFDITGTMWICSIIYVLGMKSMWHHWMWGFLMGAFFLSYMGKWVRRSNVMTAAEWMKTRFGDGAGGRLARTTYALMAVVMLSCFIGYAYQGIGKFASVYIPLEALAEHFDSRWLKNLVTKHEHHVLACTIIGATTLYVVLGGLFSVVVTDVIQTIVLTAGSLLIAGIAWANLTPDKLAALPEGFTSLAVPWRIPEFQGTANESFYLFGALVIVWVIKGLLLNAGGPGQMYDFQRFLAARGPRDAAKVGAAWSVFLVVRWAMAMGIALLALTGIAGVDDTEKVMPLVLRDFLPAGVRGLVIAGLLAAFMSTFSSTVNSAASFLIRDVWQVYVRPHATERELVRTSYFATAAIVVLGVDIGIQVKSIAQIWNWMMMVLGGGVIIPNVLRWYWWRLNGWGYAIGMFGGMLLAMIVPFIPGLAVHESFAIVVSASLVFSVVGSLATRPTDSETLSTFYRIVRPFGFWKPIREATDLPETEARDRGESASLAAVNVLLGMAAITGAYLFPMYLVGHWYGLALIWFAVALLAIVALKYTWHKNLPED